MRIPKRQEQLDRLTRKYLEEQPKAEEKARRHDPHTDVFSDEEILTLCRKAKNAAKFSDLYDAGNTAAYDGDDSDADLGLLGILKFYTQDPAQLERLFDGSALGERPKWRNRSDYRRRTIDKALSRPGETYTPPKDKSSSAISADQSQERPNPFQRSDLAKALKEGVEPPQVLVPEILLTGKVHSIYSAGGTGKTFYAAYIARKVLERGGSVLYFDQENGLRIMAERAECLGISSKMARNFYYYPFPTMPLDLEVTGVFEQLLDEIGPDLVVFDSWVNLLSMCGLDENSSVDIATWTEAYPQKARHRDIAVLILDHIPKEGGSARGSGRKLDYVDVMWELRNPQPFDRETVGRIDLHLRKDREGWLPRVLTYSVGGGEDGFVFKRSPGTTEPKDEAGLTGKERATLEALEGLGSMGAFDREWKVEAESRDVKKSKYYEAKKRLLDLGLVENVMNKFFIKDLQKRSPDESGGVHVDHAGEEVQFGPGGSRPPGPTGPPADEADEGDLFGAGKPKCDHVPNDFCDECVGL
jgi:DNA replication protein DnaC